MTIDRQRTEIKELEIKLQAMRNAANGYKAEAKRLKNELELSNADKVIAETHEKAAKEMFVDVTRHLSSVKSEAIKEFAERLKENLHDLDFCPNTARKTIPTRELKAICDWILHEIIPNEVDNLVEEMVGETE